MTCSDVQRVLPELLDDAPDGAVPAAFELHVQSCPACADLVSDLKLIASEARQLAATEEPAPRVWVRIAAELRAEGLIHEPAILAPATRRPVLVPTSPQPRWSAWWLAPIAAALLAAGSYVVSHKPAPQVAKQAPAPPVTAPVAQTPPPTVTSAAVPSPSTPPPSQKSAKPTDVVASAAKPAVEPEPSADDQQFLRVVSTRAPSLLATYENQLQAVNANIREVQNYLDRNPGDADARQQLMDAYQQKALLYQIALDRIQ
jgi:hypothetical protein